jgi:hypothetical protein
MGEVGRVQDQRQRGILRVPFLSTRDAWLYAALAVLVAACVYGLFSAPRASAMLNVTIEPVPSKTTTFRALRVEDVTGGPDRIILRTVARDVPTAPGGYIYFYALTSSAGFVSQLPQGCYAGIPRELPNEHRPTVACDYGTFDLIGLFTGAGRDRVSVESTMRYPNLSWKQIFSPNVPVFMNVFLGPGRDDFGGGDGTDTVHGGAGKDVIWGDNSNDLLLGGPGSDRLHGGDDNDLMGGGRGKDRCFGSGKDRVLSCERIRYEEF